ncbi:MAG: hypothetical protein EOP11_13320, partial [Proteobacteria bacterium]
MIWLLTLLALAPRAFALDCTRVAAGIASAENPVLALSAAHAEIRFFGAHGSYKIADQALARSLDSQEPPGDLPAYASKLVDACALPATVGKLPKASVTLKGKTAWIIPGDGPVALPPAAEAAILDLRSLGNGAGLEEALARAVAPLLRAPLPRPKRSMRFHRGLTDEGFRTGADYYRNWIEAAQPEPYPAAGSREIPIAVLIGDRIAPAAAELASALRLSNRAWIIGRSIDVSVAETRWKPVGELGVSYRFADFGFEARCPDEIPADFSTIDEAQLIKLGMPPGLKLTEGARAHVTKFSPFKDFQEPVDASGDLRAGLIIAHGAAKLFYPYFRKKGRGLFDERLLETLRQAKPNSRAD